MSDKNTLCKCRTECDRGDEPLCKKMIPAYNFPASEQLDKDSNLFVTASYIYWDTYEEGLDLATPAVYDLGTNTVTPSSHSENVIFQNFKYQSGFKVGLGYNLSSDDWVLRADYTRLHQNTKTAKSASHHLNEVGALHITNWFSQTSSASQTLAATHLSSEWHLGLDWLDIALERPFYSGRKVTMTPFIGLRGSWIKQSLNLKVNGALNVSPLTNTVESRNHLNSWGIGPRCGIDAHFLLGAGFRLQGEIGGSLLFTQFSKVSHSEDSFVTQSEKISYSFHDYHCVRPMAEANLGIGWGKYLDQQKYHLDLSATYDFNYLWGQNLLRALNDVNISRTNAAANALIFQGFTLSVRFNF